MGIFNWIKAWVSTSLGEEAPSAPPPPPRAKTEWEQVGSYLWIVLVVVLLAGAGFAVKWFFFSDPFSNWVAVVVAGDYRAHDGATTEAFDNARRDVSAKLHDIGFTSDDIMQFSVRPERDDVTQPLTSNVETVSRWLWRLASQERGGCLVYFSTHGGPQGIQVGKDILAPANLENMLDNACGDRPTVVILSACYSGVFLAPLKGPNRMIMTAARPDRTSFGCSASDHYPYYDTCVLQILPDVHGFPELADRVKDCVAQREHDTNVYPASEPQVFMGDQITANLPGW